MMLLFKATVVGTGLIFGAVLSGSLQTQPKSAEQICHERRISGADNS